MFFVIDKPHLSRIISIVRDDRTKEDQGSAGPFLRLEVKDDYVKIDGLEASGKIPATVYEPGVLFLRVTIFRKLLPTFKGEKFLTIQVTADWLLMGHVRLALESNEMLLYADPDQAPPVHPSLAISPVDSESQPRSSQRLLWDETDDEAKPQPQYPSWLCWNKPGDEPEPAKEPEADTSVVASDNGQPLMSTTPRTPTSAKKKHPAEDFCRETRAARASSLASMPPMIFMPHSPAEKSPPKQPPQSPTSDEATTDSKPLD